MSAGRVVVVGTGTASLTTAILLARRGVAVTMLGPAPPPPRGGANPTAGPDLPCALVARSRALLAAELPDVLAGCAGAGGPRAGVLADPALRPPGLVGYRSEHGDAALVTTTIPGAALTRALRTAAAGERDVDMRPGVTATGLCTDPVPGGGRVVRAVATDAAPVPASVVIDATGSGLAPPERWSTPAGAEDPGHTPADAPCGATYLIRAYRHGANTGPGRTRTVALDGCDVTVVPGTGDTWWITFAVPEGDPLATALADPGAFDAAAALVATALGVDPTSGDPGGGVARVTGATNGLTRPCCDPLGLYRVGDAAARTDPAHGIGLGLALLGAQHLARVLQCYSDPVTRAEAAQAFADTELAPWVEASVARDHARLRRWRPDRLPPEPRWWPTTSDADARIAAARDPLAWRLVARMDNLLARPDDVLERADLAEAVSRVRRSGWVPAPTTGPDHRALLDAAQASRLLAR